MMNINQSICYNKQTNKQINEEQAAPDSLQILDELASKTTICIWRINAFSGKVIKPLEICIHNNLLFVSILERFASRDWSIFTCYY
jgi:hypothetical protein